MSEAKLTLSFGDDLRRLRKAAQLTQEAAAKRLGVSRPTLTQWESDRDHPSPEHLDKLDEIYGARGELRRIAARRQSAQQGEPVRQLYVADVFRDVADALVAALKKDPHDRPLGWSRNLDEGTASKLNTAYAIRTLQLLDDARVDLYKLGHTFGDPANGYGYRRENGKPRPEVTAVVWATLARLGLLRNADALLEDLKRSIAIDAFTEGRPFIIAVVLEAALAIRPDSELAHTMTRKLLDSRQQYPGCSLWATNADAPVKRIKPSLAHTARSTAVLRIARSTTRYQAEVNEAIDMAIEWMSDLHEKDVNMIETLERSDSTFDISIHHFTSAWVIRSLAGSKGISESRIQSALKTLWESYSNQDKLWTWRDDGSLPSWMTLDAVSALRALAEASLAIPVSTTLDEKPS